MDIFTLILTFLTVLFGGITVYQNFYNKPKLSLEYIDSEPYRKFCLPYEGANKYQSEWFIRLKVKNKGKKKSTNTLGKISEWYTNSAIVPNFDPVRIHWVMNDSDNFESISIAPKDFEYLDVFFTKIKLNQLKIYTDSTPKGSTTVFKMLDEHIIRVELFSDNIKPIHIYLRTNYVDKDPEGKMRIIIVEKISTKDIKNYIKA